MHGRQPPQDALGAGDEGGMAPGEGRDRKRFAGFRMHLFGQDPRGQGMVRHPFEQGEGLTHLLVVFCPTGKVICQPQGAEKPGITRITAAGPVVAISFNIRDLGKGHALSQELAGQIKKEIANIDRILIHYQPHTRDYMTIGTPLGGDRLSISEHFGEAPCFKLITVYLRDGTITEEHLLQNPFLQEEKGKGIKVAQWLLQNRLDVLVAKRPQEGKGPGYVFGSAGVEVLLTEETEADKALVLAKKELHIPIPEGGE